MRLFPFYPIEVLIPALAFEICRKPSAKTVSCILLASDKPAPSFCSNILFFPILLQYFILLLCIFLLEIIAGILAYIYYQQVSGQQS